TDIMDGVLTHALRHGADRAINVAREPEALSAFAADKGYFDALFEASGAAAALRSGIEVVRPRGVIVQLGLGGDMTVPINLITAKEIELRGTFRFHEEFALALEFIGKGLIDVKPLITATAPPKTRRILTLFSSTATSLTVCTNFERQSP
ncbi:MAG: zinc-binding dehydrogenase, partial [Verrucomicrobia bacterium]|nr:zinc-binding dehydrogenase [Verrucomicrobiota bacterium]